LAEDLRAFEASLAVLPRHAEPRPRVRRKAKLPEGTRDFFGPDTP
jgi:hypothetical protein